MSVLSRVLVVLPVVWVAGGQSALDRGAEALRRQDPAAAEVALEEAVREQPRNPQAQKLLGQAYAAQQKYSKAVTPFRRACELDPREDLACYYLGRTYYSLNRFAEARKAFELALRENTAERGRLLYGLALTLEAVGETAPAERAYREAIAAGEKRAQIDYGMFLFRHGRAAESLALLEKAEAPEQLARVRRALAGAPAASKSPGTPPAQVRFEARELDMTVRNGAAGEKHQIETMLAGVAVMDYDNDGWPDIFVANGADVSALKKIDSSFHNRLFRNQRDGTFADVTARAGLAGSGYSMGVAAADYDNDGNVDLIVTGVRSNSLYHNRGDGTFEDATERASLHADGQWAVAAGWFDYDDDGRLDLFVVRYVAWNPAEEPYCGLQPPRFRTYCHPRSYQPLANALYHNEGGGRFRDVSAESGIGSHPGKGMGVAFGDYDGDGRLDVFVANDTTPNFLFHNLGGGKFEETALAAGVAYSADGNATSSMGADFRDFDNDGREDLFVATLTNERFLLFRNLGRGQFVDASGTSGIAASSLPWSGWSVGMFDLNNDGLKDLFAAGGNVDDNAELTSSRQSRQANMVFLNAGSGVFPLQALPGEALHRGAAFGDFDRDGRVDVVVTRLNERPLVLRNVTPGAGHWLEVRLAGQRSNRDGIGARVHVRTAAGEQWNRVTSSVGYAGSSSPVAHFGLGKEQHVLTLEIEWPSGIRQRLENLAADRLLTIEEKP